MNRTGGDWNPRAWPIYFAASNMDVIQRCQHVNTNMLIAINELRGEEDIGVLATLIDKGISIFVDSGVFWLSTQHAKRNGIRMDEALALAPDEIDDFDWLFDRYVKLLRNIGDRVWGYIEIDQGGRENKIKTRAKLEGMGFRPIPVYHPFNDGWDYFDFLAQNYDRICFGNVVQADPATRKRLVATAHERRKKYPHLWIHILGLTPNERSAAYPLPSCDLSSWLSPARWGQHDAMVANKRCWSTGPGFIYNPSHEKEGESGHLKGWRMSAYDAHMATRIMQTQFQENCEALGYSEDYWKGPA